MSVIQVECPGCQLPLKAADNMAGKKARCKKCGTAFRIPGDTHHDSVGDGLALSTLDTPVVAPPEPKSTPKAPAAVPKAAARAKAPVPADDPPPADIPDDPEPAAAQPRTAESFAFDPGAAPAPAKGRAAGESAVRKGKAARDHAPPARPPRREKAGGGTKWLVVAVVGVLVAAGAGVGGTLLFLNTQKAGDQAKAKAEDKKDAEPAAPPADATAAGDPKKADAAPKTKDGKKAPAPAKNPPARAAAPGATRGMLALPPGRTIKFEKPGDKPEMIQPPTATLAVDAPFAAARRVFPPAARDIDPAVLWQSKAGFQGYGERLTLGLFSPQTGKRIAEAGVEVDGDGAADPVCDLSANADLFTHAFGGKLTVWNTRTKAKPLDGFDPYADKPDHKAAKLAAVYLTEPPDRVVTVSTAGAVHVWELASRNLLGEYVPPKGVAGKVAAGKSVAPTPGRNAVVVAVGGAIHSVTTKAPVSGEVIADLEGDVGRSLGLGVSPAGKVLYAFETDADGKKERAVMELRGGGKREFFRWPAEAGDPASVGWCGDSVAAVGTTTGGAVLFEADGDAFRPLALALTPGKQARHVAGETHWSLVPDLADPKRSLCLGYTMPPDGLIDPLAPTKKVLTLTLTDKGLFK